MTRDADKALAGVVLARRPLDDVLNEVVGIAQAWLPGAESTSVTLMRADKAWTAAYSGRLALDADEPAVGGRLWSVHGRRSYGNADGGEGHGH